MQRCLLVNFVFLTNRLKKLEPPLSNSYGSLNNVCFAPRDPELEAYIITDQLGIACGQ